MDERVVHDVHKLGDALARLNRALEEPSSSSRALEDTARSFEYAMDLFWKVAKEMLAARGVEARMPREAVAHAHERGWLEDPSLWLEMLKDEYQISGGTVDPGTTRRIYDHIRRFYPEMCRVHALLEVRSRE